MWIIIIKYESLPELQGVVDAHIEMGFRYCHLNLIIQYPSHLSFQSPHNYFPLNFLRNKAPLLFYLSEQLASLFNRSIASGHQCQRDF